jgi:DNA repair protein RecO (recombination protein O)
MVQKFRSFRVESIVLKHHDYGEADRLVTLFTRQRGKITAIAKGIRKVRSQKGGHLEPFTLTSLLLATGRTWYLVSQAEAQDIYPNLTKDLEILGYASYLVELVDKFTYEEEENPPIFNLLRNSLSRLDTGEHPASMVARYFEIRLLDLLGFRPELKSCVVTSNKIEPENQYFSAALGGVVSPHAGKNLPGAVPISMPALKYLRHFQRSSFEDAAVAKPSDEVYQELEILMQYYLTYILERGLNTPGFLRKIRRDARKEAE